MAVPSRPIPKVPAQVEVYVDVLGVDLAVEFLLRFGGAELHYATAPTERSALVSLVGLEKARELGRHAHKLQIRVPLASSWLAACLRQRGWSVAEIARRLRRSDQTIRKYLAQYDMRGDTI